MIVCILKVDTPIIQEEIQLMDNQPKDSTMEGRMFEAESISQQFPDEYQRERVIQVTLVESMLEISQCFLMLYLPLQHVKHMKSQGIVSTSASA